MKNLASFLFCLALMAVLANSTAYAQSSLSLRGTVVDSLQGTPIARIQLCLQSSAGGKVITVISDSLGKFSFSKLVSGSYVLSTASGNVVSSRRKIQLNTSVTKYRFALIRTKNLQVLTAPIREEKRKQMELAKSVVYDQATYGAATYAWSPVASGDYEHNTENYHHIAENGYRDAKRDPLSTLSIDVDRASYSNVRRFLNDRQMPPADAVRVEEFLNYFPYNYPEPTGGQPFSITKQLTECPWNKNHELIRVGIKGKKIETDHMKTNNLVFLVDVSGSMSSTDKLPLLKSGLRLLVEQMRPEDRISLVAYAGAAGLVLAPTSGKDKEKIYAAIDALESGGSTAGGAGIQLAYNVAREHYVKEGNNRIILASDGDFNVGMSSEGELVRLIEKERESGVFLTVLGFGTGNLKDATMEQLADKGNGNYSYIDNLLEAKKVLVNEMGGTLVTIASDVKIQVEFNPAKVKAYRLVGYENRLLNAEDFNDDKKDAGELGSGHTVTALYEIIPAGSSEAVPGIDSLKYQKPAVAVNTGDEVMTIKFRYKEPGTGTSKLITSVLKDDKLSWSEAGEDARFAVAVAEFGMLLRQSDYKGTATYDAIKAMALSGKGKDEHGYRAEFISLVEVAQMLDHSTAKKD